MARIGWSLIAVLLLSSGGCASFQSKITGSSRSGAEQLLMTGTSDCAVASIDFRPLAGARVFLDTANLAASDSGWIDFSLRRAMARQGLLLVDDREDAQVIIEAALGAYGTDESDHSLSIPGAVPLGILPITTIASPSAIGRKSRQDAVVKLALIALDAATHRLVWESGTIVQSQSLDRRFLAARNIARSTTVPVLERYPPRRPW